MSQNIVVKISGLQTSGSDLEGTAPGGLEVADNVECRYVNLLEARRGFENLANSQLMGENIIRIIDFDVAGEDTVVALTDQGNVYYYTSGGMPWVLVPGQSTGVTPPQASDAKSRFVKIALNLYLTALNGVKSLASSSGSEMIPAGVQKALDLEVSDRNISGPIGNNPITTLRPVVTDSISSFIGGMDELTDLSLVQVGQFVSGGQTTANITIQDILYQARLPGTSGNLINIAYTSGGTAGSEVVTVTGNAISVQIGTGSTATMIASAIANNINSNNLVIANAFNTNVQHTVSATFLNAGADQLFARGTTITSITPLAELFATTGDTTIASLALTNVPSIAGLIFAVSDPLQATIITGVGIPPGTKAFNRTGTGPYSIQMTQLANQTITGTGVTFSSPPLIFISQVAGSSSGATYANVYAGSQVKYQSVMGRVETDIFGNTITRLSAPSPAATFLNDGPVSTSVDVGGTYPKNCDGAITFFQIYRTAVSQSISQPPLEQYQLVFERQLVPGELTMTRVFDFQDDVTDALRGAALYSGSDQEGIGQSNNPPPSCYDMCSFRDFGIYANCTQPSTLQFSILAVGGGGGIALGDEIVLSNGVVTSTYTSVPIGTPNPAPSNEFIAYLNGTPSQNITNTALSLIQAINYDESIPIHASYLSGPSDLPGRILLESDFPVPGTFTITSGNNTHTGVPNPDPFDPTLTNVVSELNISNNTVFVSKSGEIESVPALNFYPVGDTSSEILRVIATANYVVVFKTDGIYKIRGYTPSTLTVETFDLTTRIIGPDTAVGLNSDVWLFSNQGVVSVNDSGVQAQSPPIQDLLDTLIAENLPNLKSASFAIGYESDKKYILCLPSGNLTYSDTQFNYNYFTSCWTTWSRDLQFGYVHSMEDVVYVARGNTNGDVSFERNSGTYQDYVDESLPVTITAANGVLITLASVAGINIGDILFETDDLQSMVTAIDAVNGILTVQDNLAFTIASALILTGIPCTVTWKSVFGDNPAMTRQFSEGLVLFKRLNFSFAYMSFSTDYSDDGIKVTLTSQSGAKWGLFAWGQLPWGSDIPSQNIRFVIPASEQFSSYLAPTFQISQAYSNFSLQGLSISYDDASEEVGK